MSVWMWLFFIERPSSFLWWVLSGRMDALLVARFAFLVFCCASDGVCTKCVFLVLIRPCFFLFCLRPMIAAQYDRAGSFAERSASSRQ